MAHEQLKSYSTDEETVQQAKDLMRDIMTPSERGEYTFPTQIMAQRQKISAPNVRINMTPKKHLKDALETFLHGQGRPKKDNGNYEFVQDSYLDFEEQYGQHFKEYESPLVYQFFCLYKLFESFYLEYNAIVKDNNISRISFDTSSRYCRAFTKEMLADEFESAVIELQHRAKRAKNMTRSHEAYKEFRHQLIEDTSKIEEESTWSI